MAGLSQAGQVLGSGREQFWRGKLAEFAASGLSVQAFCRREALVESAFYFWRREIAGRDAKVAVAGKSKVKASKPERPAFVPVPVASQPSSPTEPGLAIELRGGRVLRVTMTPRFAFKRRAKASAEPAASGSIWAIAIIRTSCTTTRRIVNAMAQPPGCKTIKVFYRLTPMAATTASIIAALMKSPVGPMRGGSRRSPDASHPVPARRRVRGR